MERGGKATAGFHMLVVMAGVRRQHYPSPCGRNAHALQARGMPADTMHTDPWREFSRTAMEIHPILEYQPHHPHDILDLVAVVQAMVPHMAPGHVVHLIVLQVKSRLREVVESAHVIVVQVRQDD